jgi:glutathione S-transferase
LKCGYVVYRTSGEEQEKAIKDTLEMLKAMEEDGLGDKKYFGGDNIGIMDIALIWADSSMVGSH